MKILLDDKVKILLDYESPIGSAKDVVVLETEYDRIAEKEFNLVLKKIIKKGDAILLEVKENKKGQVKRLGKGLQADVYDLLCKYRKLTKEELLTKLKERGKVKEKSLWYAIMKLETEGIIKKIGAGKRAEYVLIDD